MRAVPLFGLTLALSVAFSCAVGHTDTDIDDDDGGVPAGGDATATGSGGDAGSGGDPGSGGDAGSGGAPAGSSVASSSAMGSSVASSSAANSTAVSSSSVSSSSAVSSSSSGGGGGCPTAPVGTAGCPSCGAFCDSPWNASWSPSAGATHYLVEYQCFTQVSTYQTSATAVDLCMQVGMCNNSLCANGAGAVTVKACNMQCCSSPVTVPDTPIACGGGVCC